jgi:hypothetical protein
MTSAASKRPGCTPQLAEKIIEQFGGTTAMARLCGLAAASVSGWKRNGIPRAWLLFLRERYGFDTRFPALREPEIRELL